MKNTCSQFCWRHRWWWVLNEWQIQIAYDINASGWWHINTKYISINCEHYLWIHIFHSFVVWRCRPRSMCNVQCAWVWAMTSPEDIIYYVLACLNAVASYYGWREGIHSRVEGINGMFRSFDTFFSHFDSIYLCFLPIWCMILTNMYLDLRLEYRVKWFVVVMWER